MLKGQNEIRMIWLMVLIITAVSAWFLKIPVLTWSCAVALVISVMQYVDAVQKPVHDISLDMGQVQESTSRVPLYIASIPALVGGVLDWHWLTGAGVTVWIFFFLRWLKRLENSLTQVQILLHQQSEKMTAVSVEQHIPPSLPKVDSNPNEQLSVQIRSWIFDGNPVLKVAIAILIAGVVLLLRFATEHWQLSLALKLGMVAMVSAAVTLGGFLLQQKNRSFSLALEALGLGGLFLTLFFAYYNLVIASLPLAGLYFATVLALTLWLSLRQQSSELALMAMLVAYFAPFTLPVRNATAVELVSYYLLINAAVAVLSTLRPWKYLNQIALLVTAGVGGGYAFYHGAVAERHMLSVLVLAHAAVFIWLGFRFSQLLAKEDFSQFSLRPVLDLALIFGSPLIAYSFLYLMYFEQPYWQAGFSLVFAGLYLLLYWLSQKHQMTAFIAQSYFSLMLIFLALIPPVLLPDEWSVVGWAVEGVLIFIFALQRKSALSRYLAMGLLIVAGLSSIYYLAVLDKFPRSMFWILCLSYVTVVVVANLKHEFREQLSASTVVFFCVQLLTATSMLFILLVDAIHHSDQTVISLLMISAVYLLLNEGLLRTKAGWTWLVPKWTGLMPLYVIALMILPGKVQQGGLVWNSLIEQTGFAATGLMLCLLWLRPLMGVQQEKEWVSLGTLLSLCMVSLTLLPSMPYISVVILPLLFAAWCWWQKQDSWSMLWQSRSSLLLMLIWMVCSQLFSAQAFQAYILPLLNPFDLISMLMLAGFIWMLTLQMKSGLDRGLAAVLTVLGLLWLSSYVLLRALHVYAGTPYNDLALWENGTVQLSLTLLWVSLAFVAMSTASKKQLKSVWILGGSILVIVTLKLVLFDLSYTGTLTRVISFLGAGAVMLVIAWMAPMPEDMSGKE